jgi:hypothetical protein
MKRCAPKGPRSSTSPSRVRARSRCSRTSPLRRAGSWRTQSTWQLVISLPPVYSEQAGTSCIAASAPPPDRGRIWPWRLAIRPDFTSPCERWCSRGLLPNPNCVGEATVAGVRAGIIATATAIAAHRAIAVVDLAFLARCRLDHGMRVAWRGAEVPLAYEKRRATVQASGEVIAR